MRHSLGRPSGPRAARSLRNPGLLAALLPALAACATVERTPVVTPESNVAELSPALAQASRRVLKRRVVIARFSNESLYGKSVLLGPKESLIGKKAADILATRLQQSGQFVLFERNDPEVLLAALDRGGLADMGLPADHLLVGSITEFGQSTTGETGFLSRTRKQEAEASVTVRLVDARTSRVVFAEEGKGSASSEAGTVMGMGTRAGHDSTLAEKAISAAISKLVSNLIENLLAQPWRSFLLARQGDQLVIAGGALQGLAVGDRLALVRRGETVPNPQTGIPLELPGARVGLLEVVSLFGSDAMDQGSVCRMLEGSIPEDDFARYVVEEVKP